MRWLIAVILFCSHHAVLASSDTLVRQRQRLLTMTRGALRDGQLDRFNIPPDIKISALIRQEWFSYLAEARQDSAFRRVMSELTLPTNLDEDAARDFEKDPGNPVYAPITQIDFSGRFKDSLKGFLHGAEIYFVFELMAVLDRDPPVSREWTRAKKQALKLGLTQFLRIPPKINIKASISELPLSADSRRELDIAEIDELSLRQVLPSISMHAAAEAVLALLARAAPDPQCRAVFTQAFEHFQKMLDEKN